MKLLKVSTTNTVNNESITFSFGEVKDSGKIYFSRGARLQRLIEAAFLVTRFSEPVDISVDFLLLDQGYTINRIFSKEGISTVLAPFGEPKKVLAKDDGVTDFFKDKIKGDIKDVIRDCYAGASQFRRFCEKHDLRVFGQVQKLYDVTGKVNKAYLDTLDRSRQAKERAKQLMSQAAFVTKEEVESAAASLAERQKRLIELEQQQAQLKIKLNDPLLNKARLEGEQTRARYQDLIAKKAEIEEKQDIISKYASIERVVPQLTRVEEVQREIAQEEEKRFNLVKEIDWYNEELKEIQLQIEGKHKQLEEAAATRTKVEIIKEQLERVEALNAENQDLEESLRRLQMQLDKHNSSKLELKNILSNVEATIKELKEESQQINLSNRSASEMVEALKISVKLDEIEAQIEKIRGEIIVKEGQISQKESSLAASSKQFKNILALDATVAPLKARDVIMQVVNNKIKKLEMINASLKQKERNLTRGLEEFSYTLLQIEQSCDTLSAQLAKARYKKGEEFKREVLLNTQKMVSDATSVYAVDALLEDDEIRSLEDDYAKRIKDKMSLQGDVKRVEGQIEEIKRHAEINDAEIEGLNKQKENIIARYNQLVAENSNESVFNYLRALEADKGTKYLLDVQQEKVAGETQVAELKRYVDSLRLKMAELESRHANLSSTQEALSGDSAVDILTGASEQGKNELSDALTRLSALYEKHKATQERIDELELKIYQIQEVITETSKTIKLNQKEMTLARARASQIAGGDIESAFEEVKTMQSDIEAEEVMLAQSKSGRESELFERRLALSKLDWTVAQKKEELKGLKQELKLAFKEKDVKPQYAQTLLKISPKEVPVVKQEIEKYYAERAQLIEKMQSIDAILSGAPAREEEKDISRLYDALDAQREKLKKEADALSVAYSDILSRYLDSNKVKSQLESAGESLSAINTLEDSLQNNRIIEVIIKDKIRSFVRQASLYLSVMEASLSLGFNDGLVYYKNKRRTEPSALSQNEQVLAYVALEMAVPAVTEVKGEWMVIDEKLECDKAVLEESLSKINDFYFVSGYNYSKVKEVKV